MQILLSLGAMVLIATGVGMFQSGHAWVLLLLAVAAVAVYGALRLATRLLSPQNQRDADLLSTVETFVGSAADHLFQEPSHGRRAFFSFTGERTFYLGDRMAQFDPQRLYRANDVKAWHIEHASGESCNLVVTTTKRKALRITCENEDIASEMARIFAKMFSPVVG